MYKGEKRRMDDENNIEYGDRWKDALFFILCFVRPTPLLIE